MRIFWKNFRLLSWLKTPKIYDVVAITLILAIVTPALTVGLNKKFVGHHDYNNRFFSAVGKNYLKYGLTQVRFGQLVDDSDPNDHQFGYYTHHPILLPLTLAGSIQLLGDWESSVRLVPIIFSITTLLLFYKLLRRYFAPFSSLTATLFLISTPMFLYFGKMANHEALTLFFIILAVDQFVAWQKTKSRVNFRLCVMALVIGQLSGWPAYYLGIILAAISSNVLFALIAIVSFILFSFHIFVVTGSLIGGGLWDIFLFRMGFRQLSWIQEFYTPQQFINQELSWSYHFFTPPQVLLSLASLPTYLYFRWKKKVTNIGAYPWLIFFLVALIHILLFRTGAWHHDYWLYYFAPVYAWGIAAGIHIFIKLIPKYRLAVYAVYAVAGIVGFMRSQPFFWALQNSFEK